MDGYAVIDCETTGLNKTGTDKIAEVAVVLLDHQLNVVGRHETLLNPKRDLGLVSLHGINGLMASEAPLFENVMHSLGGLLHNRIVIGQNVKFDLRFIECEFAAHNVDFDWQHSYLDTWNMAKDLDLPVPNYKLGTLCSYFNIPLDNAHSAMSDALATAQLFKVLVGLYGNSLPYYAEALELPVSSAAVFQNWLPRTTVHSKISSPYDYTAYLNRLPSHEGEMSESTISSYLQSLHLSLINGSFTYRERETMEAVTSQLDLSRSQVTDLNEEYLFFLICRGLSRNVGSWTEEDTSSMTLLRDFTGITMNRAQELLDQTLTQSHHIPVGVQSLNALFSLSSGDGLVLTGEEFVKGKDHWERHLTQSGFIVKKSTTKKGTKAVICNDPYSLSRKAVLARENGLPILTEQTVNRLLLNAN